MIRVVIADDHILVRQGIRALLEMNADIEVLGEAANGQEALQMVKKMKPDVLVMDIMMPRMNGNQVLDELKPLDLPTRVVILSMYFDETLVRQTLRSGARGYVLKQAASEEMILAIRAAALNEMYLSPPVLRILVNDTVLREEGSPFERLTAREKEVLKLIAEGHSNLEIAELLVISGKTVEKHRANILAKLGVHDLAGLIRTAIRYGLISLDP
jgi:DNA-binding NarL/FixJ family response regulator